MEHLSEQQIASLRTKLETEAAELRERIAADRADMIEDVNPGPGDIEDAAAADALRFRNKSLLDRDRALLSEVEAALARMASGSYGICEDTDDPIPFRRLELEPTARFTVEALELREREAGVVDPHGSEPVGY
jgi:DnaK suppressor protein